MVSEGASRAEQESVAGPGSLLHTAAGLDALFQAFPGLYFELDPAGLIRDYRATNAAELYVPPRVFLGRRMEEVLPPHLGARFRKAIEEAHATAATVLLEYRLTIGGAEEVFTARVVPAAHGQTIVAAQRVTAERQLEAALRSTEAQYRSFVEHAVEGVFQSSEAGAYRSVNPALARMYGYESPEELIATLTDIETQLYVDPARRREFVRRLDTEGPLSQFESEVRRKDGSIIWISESARAVRDEQGELLFYEGVVEDVTERKRVEDALRDANLRLEAALDELHAAQAQALLQERLRLVGQMASGIAHDFNNLLSIIVGYTEILGGYVGGEGPAGRYVREIRQAGDRAVTLTRRILAAGRRQVLAPEPLDLNVVVANFVPMLRRLIRADIELVTELAPHEVGATVDPVQIEQAIMNLVVNARDALHQSGRITISTRIVPGAEAGWQAQPEGSYAVLSVADNGCGMDAETRSHAFEPFFTTKAPGEGTGLGLAGIDGMARPSGGFVELHSEPAVGTLVSIFLPDTGSGARMVTEPELAPAISRGAETVLVVEDEEHLRTLITGVLRTAGYQVVEAENGAVAIATVVGRKGHIDLLLTDVVMPVMGGLELATRITEHYPGVAVLYMSGYALEADLAAAGPVPDRFLQKPFTPAALAAQVRAILDSRE